jgi:hypothetical protein
MKVKEKHEPMSLSISPEMKELLQNSAKKAGKKGVSDLLRELINDYLPLMVNEGEEIPVILKVPAYLREDAEKLRAWMNIKTNAIVNRLCNEE